MEREINLLNELREACEDRLVNDNNACAFAFVGGADSYEMEIVGDLDDIGETLYFILSRDARLLDLFAESVRIASEVVVREVNNEEE